MSVPSFTPDSSDAVAPVDPKATPGTPQRLPTAYLYVATLLTNTILLFVLLNAALAAFFYWRDFSPQPQAQTSPPVVRKDTPFFNEDGSPVDNGKRSAFDLHWFDFNAYENVDPAYAAEVLDGFFGLSKMGFSYQPWIGFAEPPYSSRLVNVDTDVRGLPIRRTTNPVRDPRRRNVFIFAMGGSPTFGYGVSDEHTWPSYLSRILNARATAAQLPINVEVINYGKAFYYPSQETALLVDFLRNGYRPNLVVFMDGVNWGPSEDVPTFTDELSRSMVERQFPPPLADRLSWLPIVRLADAFRSRLFPEKTEHPEERKGATVENIRNMFRSNMEMSSAVSDVYGVKTLFFLQPNAGYHYSAELYRRSLPEASEEDGKVTVAVYEKLKEDRERIDLSELFQEWGPKRKAIVDDGHYSPGFNEFLAQRVANSIDLKALTPREEVVEESAAAGVPRGPYYRRPR